MCDLSIALVFLQQLRQSYKHSVLKPKLNNPALQNFLPSRFRGNLLTVNLKVLELIELNYKKIYRCLMEMFAFP